MSDTPRTDDKSFDVYAEYAGQKKLMEKDLIDADFARKLERKLNTAKSIIADLLEHPYPHDVMWIHGDTQELSALKSLVDANRVQKTAREFLKKPL